MRRRKIDDLDSVRDTIHTITEFLPDELKMIQDMLSKANKSVESLNKMRHSDYVESRKILMNVSKKCMEMRETILLTHRIFTEEKPTKKDDKL